MSDLSFRPGGALKLKGESGEKKKKKKSKSKEGLVGKEVIKSKALVDALIGEDKASKATQTQSQEDSPGPGTPTPIAGTSNSSGKAKTDAERRFEEIRRRRLADKVTKLAKKTHKDRVHEFNTKLESLSEHHDIPKVGPG